MPRPSSTTSPPTSAKTERRNQLLDAAAELVDASGVRSFTMEGLAAAAGVSKALPYRHFANAEAALVALYDRELGHLAEVILEAIDGCDDGDEVFACGIHAYLDEVEARGGLLNALAGAGSPLPEMAGEGSARPPEMIAALIERHYGVRGKALTVLAALVTGLITAGSDSLGRGDAARTTVERTTVAAAIGAIHAVAQTRR